jgi:hypothetical protein
MTTKNGGLIMSLGQMRHSLAVVPKPSNVLPEHEDEIFVRLSLFEPGVESLDDPALAFTMPVSDLLYFLYGLVVDVREIVHDDVGESYVFPSNLWSPN